MISNSNPYNPEDSDHSPMSHYLAEPLQPTLKSLVLGSISDPLHQNLHIREMVNLAAVTIREKIDFYAKAQTVSNEAALAAGSMLNDAIDQYMNICKKAMQIEAMAAQNIDIHAIYSYHRQMLRQISDFQVEVEDKGVVLGYDVARKIDDQIRLPVTRNVEMTQITPTDELVSYMHDTIPGVN